MLKEKEEKKIINKQPQTKPTKQKPTKTQILRV